METNKTKSKIWYIAGAVVMLLLIASGVLAWVWLSNSTPQLPPDWENYIGLTLSDLQNALETNQVSAVAEFTGKQVRIPGYVLGATDAGQLDGPLVQLYSASYDPVSHSVSGHLSILCHLRQDEAAKMGELRIADKSEVERDFRSIYIAKDYMNHLLVEAGMYGNNDLDPLEAAALIEKAGRADLLDEKYGGCAAIYLLAVAGLQETLHIAYGLLTYEEGVFTLRDASIILPDEIAAMDDSELY